MTANDYLARFTQLLGECVITKGKMTVPWNEGFGEICDLFVRNKEASKQLFLSVTVAALGSPSIFWRIF